MMMEKVRGVDYLSTSSENNQSRWSNDACSSTRRTTIELGSDGSEKENYGSSIVSQEKPRRPSRKLSMDMEATTTTQHHSYNEAVPVHSSTPRYPRRRGTMEFVSSPSSEMQQQQQQQAQLPRMPMRQETLELVPPAMTKSSSLRQLIIEGTKDQNISCPRFPQRRGSLTYATPSSSSPSPSTDGNEDDQSTVTTKHYYPQTATPTSTTTRQRRRDRIASRPQRRSSLVCSGNSCEFNQEDEEEQGSNDHSSSKLPAFTKQYTL